MKKESLRDLVVYRLTSIAPLLFAVLPVTWSNDVLFYGVAAMCLLLFLIRVVGAAIDGRRERRLTMQLLFGQKLDDWMTLAASVVGIIVAQAVGHRGFVIGWCTCLVLMVASLVLAGGSEALYERDGQAEA